MRQLLQGLGDGETVIETIPAPAVLPGTLLIETHTTLVSAGTERMLVEFGKASLIAKVRKNPDKVREVIAKSKTDGLLTTIDAVRSKLDQRIPLGYCNSGVVIAVGSGVSGFAEGDRVASNGSHAEIVRVPANLCAKIPDGVSDEAASFTVLSAIGLQGLRLIKPTLGETIVVVGLGLIGLVTVQLLRANGCRVIGIDPNAARCRLAESFGATTIVVSEGNDPVGQVLAMTGGTGADGVIIAASTASNGPIEQAAQMSRKRGRIVLIGVVGLNLSRDMFYAKELTFQVSCSYGPGRYDPDYETHGHDYPIGFVRWTEQRNFEAILGLLDSGGLDPLPLVTHRFGLDQARDAYAAIGGSGALGVLLKYGQAGAPDKQSRTIALSSPVAEAAVGKPVAGFLGFGNYASRVLAPAFKAAGITLDTVISTGGPQAVSVGRGLGFRQASTDPAALFDNPTINALAVATRHSNHAESTVRGLEAGKAVFVEKPLAITQDQLDRVKAAYATRQASGTSPMLMVGFNRRFSPHTQAVKQWLDRRSEPASLILLMNAGKIPPDHWTQDPEIGGGRLIGEACHMVDLARFLVGSPMVSVQATALGATGPGAIVSDKVHIVLSFADGSNAVVHYLANGAASYPKERVEVFCGGGIAVIDNFISVRGYNAAGLKSRRAWRQDKGQVAAATAFANAVATGSGSPIGYDEIIEVAQACIDANAQIAR